MDTLPKDIADMCGIVMATAEKDPPARAPGVNPIQLTKEGDGTLTLTYFGKVVGWINATKLDKRDGMSYRAVSLHGDVHLCWSEDAAKSWLLARYH
jgi:hypothetical protein